MIKNLLRNRTVIGILCIILAALVVFVATPFIGEQLGTKNTAVYTKVAVPVGTVITKDMVEVRDSYEIELPKNAAANIEDVVGKYSAAQLFGGTILVTDMLTDTADTPETLLQTLKSGEAAMSIPIENLIEGLSGKLLSGDIVRIVSYKDEDVGANIKETLQYVEVLFATADDGSNNVHQTYIASGDTKTENIPVTLTLRLRDDLQILELSECANTNLHAVLVYRGDEKEAKKLLDRQDEILKELREKEDALKNDDIPDLDDEYGIEVETENDPDVSAADTEGGNE
jgi:pilus assembly protein CpaB